MTFLSMKFNHTWTHSYAMILAAAGEKNQESALHFWPDKWWTQRCLHRLIFLKNNSVDHFFVHFSRCLLCTCVWFYSNASRHMSTRPHKTTVNIGMATVSKTETCAINDITVGLKSKSVIHKAISISSYFQTWYPALPRIIFPSTLHVRLLQPSTWVKFRQGIGYFYTRWCRQWSSKNFSYRPFLLRLFS